MHSDYFNIEESIGTIILKEFQAHKEIHWQEVKIWAGHKKTRQNQESEPETQEKGQFEKPKLIKRARDIL